MQASKNSSWRTISTLDVLPPDSSRQSGRPPALRVVDVEDAVFEVVGRPAAPRMRSNDNPKPLKPSPRGALQVFIYMAVRLINLSERGLSRLSPQAFTCLISGLAILVFWLAGGFGALTAETGSLRSGPYLISGFEAKARAFNGMPVVQISGEIVNLDGVSRPTPRLEIVSVRNQSKLGGIALPAEPMRPSQRIAFSGRFQLSGQKAEDLTIVVSPR